MIGLSFDLLLSEQFLKFNDKIIKLKKALKSLQKSEDLIIFINVANTRKTTIPRPTEPATIFQVGICR